ncbi:hypothetical protein BDQ94DRAFT_164684 [Aspergillus welwitschiae]|uniref:Uncharacterized protein n=1 Tax=Aspergillus welwitschiae TaxID=1341132 RepID=A0A3F3PH44_9EURO|nr:hypothetical protein BDQ94DRAFT_164684 [Aspergillus welwitschiae]RDH26199.1 hypothetical protein BDQ94DRAFT_164684 [Aspergillus welwitschiae]
MWSPGITLAQVHSSLIEGVSLLPIVTIRRGPDEKSRYKIMGNIVRSEGREDEKLPKVKFGRFLF